MASHMKPSQALANLLFNFYVISIFEACKNAFAIVLSNKIAKQLMTYFDPARVSGRAWRYTTTLQP